MAHEPHELRPIMTRLPESLRSRLEKSAALEGRSMNAEIIHRLEQSFAKEKERGLEHRINSATQEVVNLATQQATAAVLETLGPKLDALIQKKAASSR